MVAQESNSTCEGRGEEEKESKQELVSRSYIACDDLALEVSY